MRTWRLRHPIIAVRRRNRVPRWVRRLDGALQRRIDAGRVGRAGDGALRRLSRAADHGRLWFVLAGALVVLGRPRAALRGAASLTVASAAANLLGKRLFGGPRPVWKDLPVARRLRKYPTSPSFPSGHSASAAAFAVGVAVEEPAAGLVVAPLAAAVAYSRAHVGAHWPSDVVGGLAIGVGVGALGAAILRPRRAAGADRTAVPVAPRADLPHLPDGEGVLIVLNEKAGASVMHADPRPVFAERIPAARLSEMGPDTTLDDLVREAVRSASPPRILGVYGGDGSVSRTAHLARELSLPMLAFPGGTFNHFVRAIGVDSVDDGLDALAEGRGVRVGVGTLRAGDADAVTVLNTVSVGIYPDFVAERTRREERWGKWVAAVVAAALVLRRAQPIEVDVDGERMRVWSLFASIGRNDPGRVSTMQRRSLDADELDVRILHARGSRFRAFGSLAFGRRTAGLLRATGLLPQEGDSDVERRLVAAVELRVALRDGRPVPYAHDGELETDPPVQGAGYVLRIEAHPDALEVYAP